MAKLTVIDDYTAGDTQPVLKANWGDGAVDLTGYTIVARITLPDATIFEKAATITDAAAGDFEFRWSTTDLIAGFQPFVVKFTTPGSDIFTIRSLALNIKDAV